MKNRPNGLQTCIKIMRETLKIGKTENPKKKRKTHNEVKEIIFLLIIFRLHLIL